MRKLLGSLESGLHAGAAVSARWRAEIDARAEQMVSRMVDGMDIRVDGARPEDLHVHDRGFYARILRDGLLGFGDSYVDGQWDCEALDVLTAKLLASRLDERFRPSWRHGLHAARSRMFNLQRARRAFAVGRKHYDLGNDLYEAMLDPRMIYTCAYWKSAPTLARAQEAKLDLVCRKLHLRPGMRVLDLGCGWGGFAGFAAERYGVEVIGYTVSREQARWGNHRYRHLPVELRLADYRQARGCYDAVVSIGLLEHIGRKNHRAYMDVASRCLEDGGITLIHCIGGGLSDRAFNEWFDRYIFPNAELPTLAHIARASEGVFSIEDVHNFGPDYDRTLMAWYHNFAAAWPALARRYDDRFYRMWRFYLLTCAGAFRARYLHLYQVVLTKAGTPQPHVRMS